MAGEIINHAELEDAIKDYSQRGDLDAQIQRWIDMTRYRFGQQLRALSNQVTATLTALADPNAHLYDLPGNFAKLRAVYTINADGARTALVSPFGSRQLERNRVSGTPVRGYIFTGSGDGKVFTRASNSPGDSATYQQLQLIPASGEDLSIVYWSIPAALIAGTDTNETLLQWPYLYLYACMIEAHTFTLDFDARDSMKEIYDKELMAANDASRSVLMAPGSVMTTARAPVATSRPSRSM